jgi:hypothetical protein
LEDLIIDKNGYCKKIKYLAMELLREKMVLKKACWTFGALETGRKLSLDSRRLHILIQMLIEQDMHD